MRESIGGALLIKLVMFFVIIYVAFLGIAINYSITFRVKNQIINLIEAYEGIENAEEHIEDYISSVGYFKTTVGTVEYNNPDCNNGYCISAVETTRGKYYKVTTYVTFDFPVLGRFTNFPVTGETRVIYTENN